MFGYLRIAHLSSSHRRTAASGASSVMGSSLHHYSAAASPVRGNAAKDRQARQNRATAPSETVAGSAVLHSTRRFPLTMDEVRQFREQGYLVIENVFNPTALAVYRDTVRHATERRGPKGTLPSPDSNCYDLDVEVKGTASNSVDGGAGLPAGTGAGSGNSGDQQQPQQQRRMPRQRFKIRCRSEKEMHRMYNRLKAARDKQSERRGLPLKEVPVRDNASGASAIAGAAGAAPVNNLSPTGNGTVVTNRGAVAVDDMTPEELQEQHDAYVKSEMFQNDVLRRMRIRDVTRFLESIQRPWVHLWAGDDGMRRLLTGEGLSATAMGGDNGSARGKGGEQGVGAILGRIAAELAGLMRVRLFSDNAAYRVAWGNAHALHCDQPFVDFNDHRSVVMTTVFTPDVWPPPRGENDVNGALTQGGTDADGANAKKKDSSSTRFVLGPNTGGPIVFPGSHHVMRRLTADGADATHFKANPSAWDWGEWVRNNADLRVIQPVQLAIPEGGMLITSSQLVWGHVPNYSPHEALSHTVFAMPDGAVFNGMKHTWLSRDPAGPLFEYRAGDALDDASLFPVLYTALELED